MCGIKITFRPLIQLFCFQTSPQISVGVLRHLYGLRGDGPQQVHEDHHRVQIQAAEHREEPDDQAEDDGAGPPGADVGHVPDCRAGRWRGTAGTAGERTQTIHRDNVCGGNGQCTRTTRRGILLKMESLSLSPWPSGTVFGLISWS